MPTDNQTLAALTPARIQTFLAELVNLRMDPESIARFIKRFQDFDLFNRRIVEALLDKPVAEGFVPADGADAAAKLSVPYTRALARGIWEEANARTRENGWIIFRADVDRRWWQLNEKLSEWWLPDPKREYRVRLPPASPELPIERAFRYLLNHHSRTRYCLNDECPAPYFFAKRHTQRYCSEKCAQGAEKESKRRWWAEHGSEWRQKRNLTAKADKKTKTAKDR